MSTKDPAGSRESAGGEAAPRVVIHQRHCRGCKRPLPPSWFYPDNLCEFCLWGPEDEVEHALDGAIPIDDLRAQQQDEVTLAFYRKKWGRPDLDLEQMQTRLEYVRKYNLDDPDDGTPLESR